MYYMFFKFLLVKKSYQKKAFRPEKQPDFDSNLLFMKCFTEIYGYW